MTLTLQQSAALVGGHCWVERWLFERLGAWVAPTASVPAKLALDRHSQHAAWRAAQWWDRLPVLSQVDRAGLVVAPPAWSAPAGFAGPDTDVARLAVAYRVLLPRVAVGYQRHLDATSPAADGPVARTLGQVLADIRADWVEGEALVQELVAGPADAGAAARAAGEIEARFVP